MTDIYIRPLEERDAQVSYKWRNDAEIWKYTGSRPDKKITPEIETEWLINALKRNDEKRYAICLSETHEYIGNVQLTNITESEAEFHIFIGNKNYWGKKFGSTATKMIIEFAFTELQLERIYLSVHKDNIPAYKSYTNLGFSKFGNNGDMVLMELKNKLKP
jgi:diamine N-acetyltransferase